MRSKISTFESTPMPIVRMNPAMPGSVMTAPEIRHEAHQDDEVQRDRHERVDAGQPVVQQHEQRDEAEADERGRDAGAHRVGAERRTDLALLLVASSDAGSAPDRRISDRSAASCCVKRARDPRLGLRNPTLDPRRRLHHAVQDDGELAADVLAGHARELRDAVVVQREAHRRQCCTRPASAWRCAGPGR